jgi:hypothetical protein
LVSQLEGDVAIWGVIFRGLLGFLDCINQIFTVRLDDLSPRRSVAHEIFHMLTKK